MRSWLALLLAVVVLAGCGGGDDESEPAPAPTGTTTAEAGDLELYELSSEGFAIGVPASWTATSVEEIRDSGTLEEIQEENPNLAPYLEELRQPSSPMKLVALDPEVREEFATNVNVIVEDLPEGTTAEQYEQANIANVEEGIEVEGDIAEERVTLDSGEALRVEYTHSASLGGERRSFATVQFFVTGDERGYVITYTTVPSALADYEPEFDASARSFRLL